MIYFLGVISHYRFSHGDYTPSLLNYLYSLFLVCFAPFGSPIGYVAHHRQHHKYSDTPKDPHSIKQIGWWRVYFAFWKPQKVSPSLISDFTKCKFQRTIHRHWEKVHLGFGIFFAVLDPLLLIFGISMVYVITFHVGSMQNVMGHLYGTSRNATLKSWWDILYSISLLGPDGWRHKDHHDKGYEGKLSLTSRIRWK